MEAATTERERDIAALQTDLGSVRAELEHWRNTAVKYEEEISRLQEVFTQQQQQQTTANHLQSEHSFCFCRDVCLLQMTKNCNENDKLQIYFLLLSVS